MERILKLKMLYVPASLLIHHEGKSPGRGSNILQNRLIFTQLWNGKITPRDSYHYKDDGFKNVSYTTNDHWLAPQYRTVSVMVK